MIRAVAGDRVSQMLFAVVTFAAGLVYSVLLPFDYTMRVSFGNWRFLSLRYAAFATALALGLAWVITLQVYAMRQITRRAAAPPRRGGLGGALAAVVSLLPSFLCCSPIVPTVIGLLGLPLSTQVSTSGTVTYFFATNQNWLLAGALVLLAGSGVWSVRKLARAECLDSACPTAEADLMPATPPSRQRPPYPAGLPGLLRPPAAELPEEVPGEQGN